MGYWVNTTYVNHGTVADVAHALDALCAAEGMQPASSPMQRERLLVEPMQYDGALQNDLWGFAVFPGVPSWTVIQTAPLELLAERAAGAARVRLADLCVALSASAFQLDVYDSTATVLLEVSKAGEVFTSGFTETGLEWHGEQLSDEYFEAQFRHHPFQALIADATVGDEIAAIIARHLGGGNAAFCDNVVSVDTLISHKPFVAPGGVALYYQWPGPSRQRYASCASWAEYHAALGRADTTDS
jgi:hypothetical protein